LVGNDGGTAIWAVTGSDDGASALLQLVPASGTANTKPALDAAHCRKEAQERSDATGCDGAHGKRWGPDFANKLNGHRLEEFDYWYSEHEEGESSDKPHRQRYRCLAMVRVGADDEFRQSHEE
jgi:hypothetical protein